MSELTDPNIGLKDFTIETCYNSGLGELIDDISKEQELLTFKDKAQIPIPQDKILNGSFSLTIGPTVQDIIDGYSDRINNPARALEYPFLIMGTADKSNKLSSLEPPHSNDTRLSNERLKMQDYSEKLYNEIINSKKFGHDILVLGHTHPKPTKKNFETLLTNKLSPTTKEKHKIRELGLNLSLQDLYQLVYFEEAIKGIAKDGTKAMICVTMYNGDTTYVYIEDGKFKKAIIKEKGGTSAPPS